MEWMRLLGMCLLAGALVMLLGQMQPQAAALLSIAFGAVMISVMLEPIAQYIQTVRTFLDSLHLDKQYYKILIKSMGVVLVTQLAVQACEDMQAPSIARRAEFVGRMTLLSMAVPVFMELTQMAVNALQ